MAAGRILVRCGRSVTTADHDKARLDSESRAIVVIKRDGKTAKVNFRAIARLVNQGGPQLTLLCEL